ncbi:Uncharacterized protein PECH_001053 [Penicillium ucsense]|uniref:polynucleotide adenylyltransferase n=1 Tax=Penicillium ucsense TaxID=2839758 RepID=A0A8J8WM90_9EURO|nr:Uncharacterized protein PECM_002388 [Penicillium ucsense]KAF7738291.1 Uncharacterized protein PECH_001053 [Penicillium ucsense]
MSRPFQFRGNGPPPRGARGRNPRHEFSFRPPPRHISERPLLRGVREPTPELLFPETESKPAPKFASLENLSDSEEAEMELSDDEDSDAEARPRKKRVVGTDGQDESEQPLLASIPTPAPVTAPTPPQPKWSNPDPYTALPPPDDSQHKRVDVVKLIRKARLAAIPAEAKAKDAVADNDDFISLGAFGDTAGGPDEPENQPPANAPTGPKASEAREPAAESRKRTRDDQPKPLTSKHGKPLRRFKMDGSILDEWLPFKDQNATPWMVSEPSLNVAARLQNEILAFYQWVKPQRFEQIVRQDVVDRLERAFQKRYSGVTVHAFGSFASGMYLPTADIDLVLLSTSFANKGIRAFGDRRGQIYAFAAFVRTSGLAVDGTVEAIAHARVPILKWVDKLTGLRVDLSFDNDSGLLANRTFQEWSEQYPMMPVLVSVVKQFLLLRGLNEVPTGGLGGFSITCIVTSLLQHMPRKEQENIGAILMEFFYFYGKIFNYEKTGIRMHPPGYYNKTFEKSDRLSIEDPNNPANDISGGTKEVELIFRTFRSAYWNLRDRMDWINDHGKRDASILDAIIAANYDEYLDQRDQLRRIFDTAPQFAKYRQPPPPPPPLPAESPPPPPPTGPRHSRPAARR